MISYIWIHSHIHIHVPFFYFSYFSYISSNVIMLLLSIKLFIIKTAWNKLGSSYSTDTMWSVCASCVQGSGLYRKRRSLPSYWWGWTIPRRGNRENLAGRNLGAFGELQVVKCGPSVKANRAGRDSKGFVNHAEVLGFFPEAGEDLLKNFRVGVSMLIELEGTETRGREGYCNY